MLKKARILTAILSLVFLSLAVTGCGAKGGTTNQGGNNSSQGGQSGPGKAIVLKFAHGQPVETLAHKTALEFAKVVEQKTSGQVKIEVYPANQLGNERDLAEGLALGTIDLAYISAGVMENLEPKIGVMNLPYVFRDYNHVHKVLDGPIGKEVSDALLKSKKIHTLAYFDQGFRFITNNIRPIKTLDDLKGIKLRVPEAPMFIQTFKLLGANTTPIPWGEVYTSLQTKVVDGQENFAESIWVNKMYEVQKYVSKTYHIYAGSLIMTSDAAWQKLSPDQQQALQQAAHETFDKAREQVAKDDDKYFNQLKEKGMQINDIPDLEPFRQAVKPIYTEWGQKVGDTNLVQKILDTK